MGENTGNCKNMNGECTTAPKTQGGEKHGCMKEWEAFLGVNLPHKSKSCFPKTDGFTHSNLDCHTLPIPCNNQLNQLLVVINDWVNMTRKVVDSWWVLPLIFVFSPLAQGFEYPPALSLGNHSPISLLFNCIVGCGFLIKLHIYMMSKIRMCWLAQKYHRQRFLIAET